MGAYIIRWIESAISKRKQPSVVKGEVVASREIIDWDDPEVARALHDKWLRKIEEGWNKDDIEPCHCVLCDERKRKAAVRKIAVKMDREVRSKDGIWRKNGYVFKSQGVIPSYAFLGAVMSDSNPTFAKGHFSWVDKESGGMKFAWVVGIKEDSIQPAIYLTNKDIYNEIKSKSNYYTTLNKFGYQFEKNTPRIGTEKYKK